MTNDLKINHTCPCTYHVFDKTSVYLQISFQEWAFSALETVPPERRLVLPCAVAVYEHAKTNFCSKET